MNYLVVPENVCIFAVTMGNILRPKIILEEIKQRRKELRELAKNLLIGQILSHPYFPHDIYINVGCIVFQTTFHICIKLPPRCRVAISKTNLIPCVHHGAITNNVFLFYPEILPA